MNALGRALRRLGMALVELTNEAAPPPAQAPALPPERELQLDRELRDELARLADERDAQELREQGRVMHRIGSV